MKLKEIKDLTSYSDIIKWMVRQEAKEIRSALPQGVRKAFLQGDELWVITKNDEVYSLTVSSKNPSFDRVSYPLWNDVVIVDLVTDSFTGINRIFVVVKGTVEDIKKIGDIIGDSLIRIDITDKEQIKKEINELEFKRSEFMSSHPEVVRILKEIGCFIVNHSFRFGKYRFALSKNHLTEVNVTNKKFRYSDGLERRLKKFLLEKMI
jgi:hypothetical protein